MLCWLLDDHNQACRLNIGECIKRRMATVNNNRGTKAMGETKKYVSISCETRLCVHRPIRNETTSTLPKLS